MAYAAVLSLKQTIKHLLSMYDSKNLISFTDMVFISQERDDVDSFLETIKSLPSSKIVDSAAETRVRDAVQLLQDLIDYQLSDLLLLTPDHQSESVSIDDDDATFALLFYHHLPQVKEEFSSFLTSLKEIDEDQQQRYYSTSSSSSSSDYCNTRKKEDLVGMDVRIERLKEWIYHPISVRFVTLVVGMTGVGKNTLVKQFYNDPRVVQEFEPRLFVHIGPGYNRMEDILLLVLNQLGFSSEKLLHQNKDDLKHQLSEALSSKKYLIVLEDVWTDDFDVRLDLQYSVFPNNENGSRVIIVSQIQNLDRHTLQIVFQLPFLDDNESWKLLRLTAFTSEGLCDRELEKIGKKIAKNCKGLPPAIIHVGENLRGKSFQEWEALAEKEDPLVITRDDYTPLSKALYFSYMALPQYLKLLFLYMGVFPKDYGISRSKLVKLWVSEGFLDTYDPVQSAEENAGMYLDLLICRSVVLRGKETSLNIEKSKNCRLHFTFRSLCVNEAKSENFFHVLKKYTDCKPENIKSQQRLSVHNNVVLAFREVYEWMESIPNVRSLVCFGPKQQYPIVLPLFFRLLKILDALAIRFYEFPHQILALVHLKYLAITCDGELPTSISKLWNLEVLIVSRHDNIKLLNNCPVYLPKEIWKLHKLKQLYCMGFDLPPPPPSDEDSHLEKLLTLSGVSVYSCTVEVLSRIPNLTRVAVQIESAHDSIETFDFFVHFTSLYQEFKSVKCVVVNPNLKSQVVPCDPSFPVKIQKICLSGCGLPWENMKVIAALPNLRVLKLL